jgi:hypothetical protein
VDRNVNQNYDTEYEIFHTSIITYDEDGSVTKFRIKKYTTQKDRGGVSTQEALKE